MVIERFVSRGTIQWWRFRREVGLSRSRLWDHLEIGNMNGHRSLTTNRVGLQCVSLKDQMETGL